MPQYIDIRNRLDFTNRLKSAAAGVVQVKSIRFSFIGDVNLLGP